MNPIILFRGSLAEEEEKLAAAKYFDVYESRAKIPPHSLVIPRYSALPYYIELENDVDYLGSSLINTYKEHRFVADLQNWYQVLEDVTPKTWFRLEDLPEKGPFVVKGETNSKKFDWNTHMYAETKRDAVEVASRLYKDSLLAEQNVYARQYVPLNPLAQGLAGLTIAEEYRFFVVHGKIVASGFYWASHVDDLEKVPETSVVPSEFIENVIRKVGYTISFYVIDVARTADGGWIVIELNDGQQAGLSCIDPYEFYRNLRSLV